MCKSRKKLKPRTSSISNKSKVIKKKNQTKKHKNANKKLKKSQKIKNKINVENYFSSNSDDELIPVKNNFHNDEMFISDDDTDLDVTNVSTAISAKDKIVIYKPIEHIERKEDFPEKRKDGCDNYWELFSTRQTEIDEWGDNLQEYIKNKHDNTHDVIVVQHGGVNTKKILQQLTANDTVYIHSHGNSEKVGLRPYGLSYDQLAKRIEKDGIQKENTPRLKFWSCHSGDSIPGKEDSSLSQEVGSRMKTNGYQKFTTFGYQGEVMAILNIKKTKFKEVKDTKGQLHRAKNRRVRNDY